MTYTSDMRLAGLDTSLILEVLSGQHGEIEDTSAQSLIVFSLPSDLTKPDAEGRTPLHHAISRDRTQIAATLIDNLARKILDKHRLIEQLTYRDNQGKTPLQWASELNNLSIVNLLEKTIKSNIPSLQIENPPPNIAIKYVEMEEPSSDQLNCAIATGDERTVLSLIARGIVFENYSLYLAIQKKMERAALALIPKVHSVHRDLITYEGKTVLQHARTLELRKVADAIEKIHWEENQWQQ